MLSSDAARKNVTLVGGLLVDDIAISTKLLRPRSSNPVQWQHRLGGVATNVARVVSQQIETLLVASIGTDNQAPILKKLLQQESITASLITRQNQPSDRYTAVLDQDGELYVGLADVQLAEQITWDEIASRLPELPPDALVLDANLSADCLRNTIESLDDAYKTSPPIFALAVSPVKSARWLPIAHKVDTLLCNRREACALTQLDVNTPINEIADALLQQHFKRFVLTDGNQTVLVQDTDQRHAIPVTAVPIEQTVNGAGDALAGATISQYLQGSDLAEAVAQSGMEAARAVLCGDTRPPSIQ